MESEVNRVNHRATGGKTVPDTLAQDGTPIKSAHPQELHPGGAAKHGRWMQFLRGLSLGLYFGLSCVAIAITQLIGVPLYWYDRDMYYAYMAYTKQSFALLSMSITQWWGPTVIRMSGDESVADQMKKTPDGRVEFTFPERLVLIANHQIYTDWLYLWWAGYANNPQMHGYLYIILKESLKYIPIMGLGMMFYGFIFMSRKMAVDGPRMAYRLSKLKQEKTLPNGKKGLSPMWLLLFPEGTNISNNGRRKSKAWAEKNGLKDPDHLLLPRSTGTQFCLKELKGTVEYVYDCTVAYEGVPRGKFGEEYFTLSSTYFQGRPPKSVNFYWRRFKVSEIPIDDPKEFDEWLRKVWYEKDAYMETYLTTGRFPPCANGKEYVETAVRTKNPFEFAQIYVVLLGVYLAWNVAGKMWNTMLYGGW